MNLIPLQTYEAPKSQSANYFKFQEGENRIRILSQAIFGWEDWDNKKPIRYRMNDKPSKSIDPKKPVKHFWAFIVFNYRDEQIQIMEITQATIRKSLEALCRDKDWGAPFAYDVKINKTGEGVDTEYTVNPVPHKPVDDYIVKCFMEKPIYLEALFDNADPFVVTPDKYTPLATVESIPADKKSLSDEQQNELANMFTECSPEYKRQLMEAFSKFKEPINDIRKVPLAIYENVRKAVIRNRDEYKKSQQEQLLIAV